MLTRFRRYVWKPRAAGTWLAKGLMFSLASFGTSEDLQYDVYNIFSILYSYFEHINIIFKTFDIIYIQYIYIFITYSKRRESDSQEGKPMVEDVQAARAISQLQPVHHASLDLMVV